MRPTNRRATTTATSLVQSQVLSLRGRTALQRWGLQRAGCLECPARRENRCLPTTDDIQLMPVVERRLVCHTDGVSAMSCHPTVVSSSSGAVFLWSGAHLLKIIDILVYHLITA